MSERRLGQALRAVVAEEKAAGPGEDGGESVLMNPNRQRIFEHLCFFPCSSPAQVAGALRLSGPTVQWHLSKLRRADYIRERAAGRSRLFFPSGLGLEEGEVEILAAVNGLGGSRLLGVVVGQPGLTLRQLAEASGLGVGAARVHARRLARAGLLVVVADGRYRRFYASEALVRMERAARRKLRVFRARLLRRLERERLNPSTRLSLSRESEVEVRVGERSYLMRLPSESFLTSLLPEA